MKTAEKTLSECTDYSVEELVERQCEPILQPFDCLKAMHEFASQSQWIAVEERLKAFDELTERIGTEANDLKRNHEGMAAYSHCYIELINWRNKWQPLPTAPEVK